MQVVGDHLDPQFVTIFSRIGMMSAEIGARKLSSLVVSWWKWLGWNVTNPWVSTAFGDFEPFWFDFERCWNMLKPQVDMFRAFQEPIRALLDECLLSDDEWDDYRKRQEVGTRDTNTCQHRKLSKFIQHNGHGMSWTWVFNINCRCCSWSNWAKTILQEQKGDEWSAEMYQAATGWSDFRWMSLGTQASWLLSSMVSKRKEA